MSTPDGTIPYIDVHDGPKRILSVTVDAFQGALFGDRAKSMLMPVLHVDGRAFIVYWGQVSVEVPADRPVHLAVGLQDGARGASLLLPAGAEALAVDYYAPQTGPVSFGVRPPRG